MEDSLNEIGTRSSVYLYTDDIVYTCVIYYALNRMLNIKSKNEQ